MSRFNPSKYDAAAESSPVPPALAKRIDGYEKATASKILVVDQSDVSKDVRACESGSRLPVQGKSRFNPGKDATLKGMLIRAHLTDTQVAIVRPDLPKAAKVPVASALDVVKEFYPKLESWLERAAKSFADKPAPRPRQTAEEKAAKAEARKAAAAEKKAAKAAASGATAAPKSAGAGDKPELNGSNVEFMVGRNTIKGSVVRVVGDVATVAYETKAGKDAEREVKEAKLKFVS